MGSLDAGLAGLFDYLLKDRETIKAQERDDKQWESRERLRARIGLDIDKEKAGLQEKRGDAYQTEDGTWLVPLYDGFGKQKGTAQATSVEQANARKAGTDATTSENQATITGVDASAAPELSKIKLDQAQANLEATRAQTKQAAQQAALALRQFNYTMSQNGLDLEKSYNSVIEGINASSGENATAAEDRFRTDYASARTDAERRQIIARRAGQVKAKLAAIVQANEVAQRQASAAARAGGGADPLDRNGQ